MLLDVCHLTNAQHACGLLWSSVLQLVSSLCRTLLLEISLPGTCTACPVCACVRDLIWQDAADKNTLAAHTKPIKLRRLFLALLLDCKVFAVREQCRKKRLQFGWCKDFAVHERCNNKPSQLGCSIQQVVLAELWLPTA